MKELETGSFVSQPSPCLWPTPVRVVSWNVNRGLRLDGVIDFLRASRADLILLQETDVNARRTSRRNIPREIAQALRMDYVFGREFQELSQGSQSNPAWHGQTTLSRLPLSNARIFGFHNQSMFWRPRRYIPPLPCLQRRRGARMALICEIALGAGTLLTYNVHLESRGSDELRIRQMSEILADIGQQPANTPVLLAGDFNFDLFREPAVSLIAAAEMNHPFALLHGRRTVLRTRRAKPAAIDWMLTRGALSARRPAIHESTAASDHFPLSLELGLE
jgi:endonuclease/exonuclease/phosphatase family metal-dependent hydrolase